MLPTDEDCEQLRLQGKVQESIKLHRVLRRNRESGVQQDQPEDADEYNIDLSVGDLIVSATDGVFDNLFNHEILAIIQTEKA